MQLDFNRDFYPFGLRGRSDFIAPMEQPHRHTEIELFSMRGGSYTRKFGDQTDHFDEDEVLVYWGCIPHQLLEMPTSGQGFVAYFPLESFLQWNLPSVFTSEVLAGNCLRIPLAPSVAVALKALRQWLPASGREGSSLPSSERMIVEGCLGVIAEEALVNLPTSSDKSPSQSGAHHVSKMIEFAVHNRCEPIVADDICTHAGLHPTYGRTLFKKTVGISLHQFLTNHRLEHAKNLLANTEALIIEVALESGFGSVSRFHAIFKSRTALTPRAFRQAARRSVV